MPVLMTGIMLAIARAAGETAPLIFTALFFDYWPHAPFVEPTASLPVLIYNFSAVPYPEQIKIAWTASLVLVVFVLIANLAGQFALGRSGRANDDHRLQHMRPSDNDRSHNRDRQAAGRFIAPPRRTDRRLQDQ
jgi:hypothetical protein